MHATGAADRTLLARLGALLLKARAWAEGADDTDGTDAILADAAMRLHRRYRDRIARYHDMAVQMDRLNVPDLQALVDDLMVPEALFKSYPSDCLAQRDFPALTAWLGTICAEPVLAADKDLADLTQWRDSLKTTGIYVAMSSGSSGRMSFVPRDRMTLNFLRGNNAIYAQPHWRRLGLEPGRFDCLVLGQAGFGVGLRSAGTGLARTARRAHFLIGGTTGQDIPPLPRPAAPAERTAAVDFLSQAIAEDVPLMLFGTPFQVADWCAWLVEDGSTLTASPGSAAITGGGWKTFTGERLDHAALSQRLTTALAIPADRHVDTYSAAELNCAFMRCPAGRYHLPPLIRPVVFDSAFFGTLAPGTGQLGYLDPFALSYPGFVLTGDHGTTSREPCSCGLSGWSIVGDIQRQASEPIRGCSGVLAH